MPPPDACSGCRLPSGAAVYASWERNGHGWLESIWVENSQAPDASLLVSKHSSSLEQSQRPGGPPPFLPWLFLLTIICQDHRERETSPEDLPKPMHILQAM